jgi:hypothetical protein
VLDVLPVTAIQDAISYAGAVDVRPNGSQPTQSPPPLVVAASLVAVEGLMLLVLAVLEVASFSSERIGLGLTTAGFFLIYGLGLLWCAWSVHRRHSWARSPIVLSQLIALGMAWSLHSGGADWAAIGVGVVGVVVLAGILHPASIEALGHDAQEPR